MQPREVIFAPEARDDLKVLYKDIADAASPGIAFGYLERLEEYCRGFSYASMRGHSRNDVRRKMRWRRGCGTDADQEGASLVLPDRLA